MRKSFQKLLAEYGAIAVVVYFTIFFATWIGAWAAIQRGVNLAALAARFGFSSNGIVANLGAWTAAYIFTKLLQPVRIGVTLLLTPLLARVWERTRGAKRPDEPAP